jgi:hypothetical protein
MQNRHRTHNKYFIIGGSLFCLCCLVVGLLIGVSFQIARDYTTPIKNPTLKVEAGFGHYYRSNYWTPVRITLTNPGPAFKGTLSLHIYTGITYGTQQDTPGSPWSFEQAISLARGVHQTVTMYAPYFLANLPARGFVATLRNTEQKTVASQWSGDGNEVKPGDLFIGILGPENTDINALQATTLPGLGNPLNTAFLDAHSFPDKEAVLENFDVLILENFPMHTFSSQQMLALQTWVNRGGILLEIGGTHWKQTLQGLPANMLPVTIDTTRNLSLGSSLLPIQTPSSPELDGGNTSTMQPLDSPIPISTAVLRQQSASTPPEIIVGDTHLPLMVKVHRGAGTICYLAFDPTMTPLNSWSGASLLWQNILSQTLGDRLIESTAQSHDSGPGRLLTHGGILNMVKPVALNGPTVLNALLCSYVCFLGLLCLLLLRRFKQAYLWRWRLLLSCVIVFSLGAYGLAYLQKKTAFTANAISLLQLNQDSSSAHITTFTGLFLPTQGTFQFHISGQNLSEPVSKFFTQSNPLNASVDDTAATIMNNGNNSDVTIQNNSIWAFNPLVTEQEKTFHGSLATHFALHNNRLVGTITNTLPTPLSDLYILFPHTFVDLGKIAARQTRLINLSLHSIPSNQGKTLTDQIDEYYHLPMPYFPYETKQLPHNEFQQHMALLSALSGTGFHYDPCAGSCLTHAIIDKNSIYVTGGQVPNPNLKDGYDPLLIPGAQATLIGWTNQYIPGVEDTTAQDTHLAGQHISFLQMPLNLNITDAAHMPQDLITGNLTGVQSYDAQALLPGIYSLSSGNVTFDLPLTNLPPQRAITLNVPDLIAHPAGPGSDTPGYKSNVVVHLYNWQTSRWDLITFIEDTYKVTQVAAYIGPNNHLLIEIANHDQNAGQIYFGKPSVI